jgi:hypothetical protein
MTVMATHTEEQLRRAGEVVGAAVRAVRDGAGVDTAVA